MDHDALLNHGYRIIDCHNHVFSINGKLNVENYERLLEAAYVLGIEKICISNPISGGCPSPEEFKEKNDVVIEAMRRDPDKILGYAYVNPGYAKEAMAEMERCINEYGMIGIKLYNQYHISNPVVYQVIEKAIQIQALILSHAGKAMDPDSKRHQPFISDGTHFAKVARIYPEATFIQGHIGGGGDWEWSIKALRGVPNVYLDTSGSVVDDRMIEIAVKELGVQRILFATDMTFEGGVGKILGAHLTHKEKELIFWDNFYSLLEKEGKI